VEGAAKPSRLKSACGGGFGTGLVDEDAAETAAIASARCFSNGRRCSFDKPLGGGFGCGAGVASGFRFAAIASKSLKDRPDGQWAVEQRRWSGNSGAKSASA